MIDDWYEEQNRSRVEELKDSNLRSERVEGFSEAKYAQ